jgi:hypothetical protein
VRYWMRLNISSTAIRGNDDKKTAWNHAYTISTINRTIGLRGLQGATDDIGFSDSEMVEAL